MMLTVDWECSCFYFLDYFLLYFAFISQNTEERDRTEEENAISPQRDFKPGCCGYVELPVHFSANETSCWEIYTVFLQVREEFRCITQTTVRTIYYIYIIS